MTIPSLDGYIAAAKQRVSFVKTATRTTVAITPYTTFDLAGNPSAGTLAGTNATNGVVPTSATPGFPTINAFGSGNTGYLSKVEYSGVAVSRQTLFDVLFKAGTYSYAAGTSSLSSQPSYSSRLPNGDYNGTEIWLEVTTAFATGNNWQVQATYTNQAGTTGRTTIITPALAAAALALGRHLNLPLQAGDTGVQKIESVIVTNGSTAMTAGAFNMLVKRRLWSNRVLTANGGGINNFIDTGMPIVYADSALEVQITPDSTGSGAIELSLEIANG